LLLGLPQQHSDLLPGHHRWLHWRHVVLPQLQAARCGDCWWTSVEKASKTSKKMAIGRIIFSRHGLIINGYII
jgi:hypothetical protein